MHVVQTVVLVTAALVGVWAVLRFDPAWTLSLGIAASVFSAHWDRMGVPVPLDRVLLAAGAAVLLLRIGPARDRPPLRLGTVHLLLLAVVLYVVCSAVWAGTLGTHDGRYTLLDRLGAVPFAMFAIAPVAFPDRRRRGILLGTLVVLGLYLGLTSLFEGAKLGSLVWPRYILDPTYGPHANRARGPFVEAVGNGQALIACAAAALMALGMWRDRAARLLAAVVVGLCSVGIVVTYTRSVWIAAVLAFAGTLVAYPALRPRLIPAAALTAGALALSIALVPGLGTKLDERYHDKGPVTVRQHTNDAALRMIAAKPVFGWGWRRFTSDSHDYFRDLPDIKMTGFNEDVHNVVLGRTVELGIVGGGLWAFALIAAFGFPLLRRVPAELAAWQRLLLALMLAEIVAAMLTPLGFYLQALLIATVAGMVGASYPGAGASVMARPGSRTS